MPTGYTEKIKDGISFEEFALSCARQFGACVSMRDDPMDMPIPDKFEPSDWHKKALLSERRKLYRLNRMTVEQATTKALREYRQEVERREKSKKRNKLVISSYREMLRQVEAWIPPTPDHVELKKFMIQQITDSIDHDDMSGYYEDNPPILLSGTDWLELRRKDITNSIDYHKIEYAKEVDSTNGRSEWVKSLRNSLMCSKFGTSECDTCKKRFRCFTMINYRK